MGTEVDSLEVKVEASAKSANASLTNLAKRLGTVSQQLQSVCSYQPTINALTGNLEGISKLDFKNVKALKNAIKTMSKDMAKINGRQIKISVNKLGDVENAAKKVTDLSQKVAEASKSIKISVDSSEVNSAKKACDELKKKTSGLKASAQTIKKASGQLGASDGKSVLSGAETKTVKQRVVPDSDKGIAEEAKEASKLSKILSGTKKVSKSLSNTFGKMGKTVSGVVSKAKDLKNLITRTNKSGGQMSMGRMLGMSLVFSTVFSALSAINNAIKEGSNNLVQYSSDYNKSISGIVTSLLYLKNAWAAAFAPIVNAVAPYISKFIDMLAGAMNMVGQFTAALTGKGTVVQAKKAWKDYAASLDTTKNSAKDASDALKDLMNYTLGIDELNVIQPSSSGSSGSGSSGSTATPSPSDMFETIEVSNSMNQLADKFKEALKNSDFTEIGKMVGDKLNAVMESIPWDEIYHKADNFGKDLATFLNGLISPELFYNIGSTIASSINTALHSLNSFAANFDWSNFGASLASSITGFFETWDAELTGETLSNFATGILESLNSAIDTLDGDETFEKIGQKLVDFICGINWKKLTWDLTGFALSLRKAIIDFPTQFLRGVVKEFLKKTTNMSDEELEVRLPKFVFPLSGLGLAGIGRDIVDGIIKGMQDGRWKDPFKLIKEVIFDPFITSFCNLFGIHSPSTVMAEQGGYIMDGLLNGVTDKLQSVLDFFGDLKEKIVEKFDDVKDWFGDKFGKAREAISEKFSDVGTWFGNKKSEIQDNTKDIDTWMNTKYTNARKYVNSAFSDVGTWFGNRRNDIQNNIKNISNWFSEKFKSSRLLANAPFSDIGSWFGQKREDIKSNMESIAPWFKDIFKSAYNGITSIFDKIGGYFDKVAGWIKSPVLGAVKAIANAVNWVYDKLGGNGDLIDVSGLNNYASGTNGVARDSFGVVNDQSGNTYRELVQYPNGQTVIPTGRNVVLPMPKGTKVMPAGQTAALMGITGVKKYKSGIGNFFGSTADKISDIASNIFGYIKDPKKLLKAAIDKFTDLTGALEPGITLAKTAVNSLFDTAVSKIKGFFDSFGAVDYKPSSGVEQWRGLAKQALLLTNQFSESNLNALLNQMMHESGGNPNAINNWDINAIRGIPSKGLMQVIDPTFRANAMEGFNTNIYDPLSNMIAAINYTVKRYGSLYAGWTARGYKGYANGIGTFKLSDVVGKYSVGGFPQNGELFVANEKAPEYVGRMGNRNVVANNNQIVTGVSNGVAEANRNTERLLQKLIEQNERLLRKNTSLIINSKKVNKELSRGSRNSGYSFSTT